MWQPYTCCVLLHTLHSSRSESAHLFVYINYNESFIVCLKTFLAGFLKKQFIFLVTIEFRVLFFSSFEISFAFPILFLQPNKLNNTVISFWDMQIASYGD